MNKEEIFDSVEDCIADFAQGKIIIVADDEGRENEGDMICAGEKVTPEIINTMVRYARGLVCVPMTSERLLQKLQELEKGIFPILTLWFVSFSDFS